MIKNEIKIANYTRPKRNFGFDIYTVVEYGDKKIMVSTIGMLDVGNGIIEPLGTNGRYYETMCFLENTNNANAMVEYNGCDCLFGQYEDDEAHIMHENAVKEISNMLITDNIKII